MDPFGELPRLLQRVSYVFGDLGEELLRRPGVRVDRRGCEFHVGGERDQELLHAFVQLTFDLAALGVGGHCESPARRAQLLHFEAQRIDTSNHVVPPFLQSYRPPSGSVTGSCPSLLAPRQAANTVLARKAASLGLPGRHRRCAGTRPIASRATTNAKAFRGREGSCSSHTHHDGARERCGSRSPCSWPLQGFPCRREERTPRRTSLSNGTASRRRPSWRRRRPVTGKRHTPPCSPWPWCRAP